MIKKISILATIFSIFSYSKSYSSNNAFCFASSAMIFWKTESKNAETEIKKILTDLSIEYKDLDSQSWDSETSEIGGIRDYKLSQISTSSNSWTSLGLHLNSTLFDKISIALSKITNSPVIVFLEYDQDAWGYCLYLKGKIIDEFWNNYIVVELESKKCSANIDLIASKFQVDKKMIEPYLRDISNKDNLGKAFENDEFDLENHWVRADFMEKLGLQYPEKGKWFQILEERKNR